MAEPKLVPPPAASRPPTSEKYKQLILQPLSDMASPYVVRNVLAAHDLGQFGQSALLWEQMRRDDRIGAVMSVRINALMGLEHAFKAKKKRGAKPALKVVGQDGKPKDPAPTPEELQEQDAIDQLDELWTSFSTPEDRKQIVSWALGVGFAFGRLEWVATEDRWTPKVVVWHPSFVTWRESERGYYVSTANRDQVEVTPGKDGWWLWTPFGFNRGWAEGYVHKLAMPWLARQWAYRDWARSNELHGLPMVKAFIPAGAQDDDQARFLMEIANRQSAPTVRLPLKPDGTKLWDFDLVEAKETTWQAFQNMKSDANVDIAVSVLGQNLTTEVQGGSYAAAKVQDKVRGDILDSDARAFEAFFNGAVVAPFAQYNLPGDPNDAPQLRFQTQEVDDLVKVGQGLGLLGDGISKAKAAGVQVDVDEVTRRVDVPTTGKAKEPEPKPAPPPMQPGGFPPRPGMAGPGGGPPLRQFAASDTLLPTAENTQEKGQAYADAIVDTFTRQGVKVMNEDRLKVLSVVLGSDSFDEMEQKLREAYADMDPAEMAGLIRAAIVEAELDGWYSARGM